MAALIASPAPPPDVLACTEAPFWMVSAPPLRAMLPPAPAGPAPVVRLRRLVPVPSSSTLTGPPALLPAVHRDPLRMGFAAGQRSQHDKLNQGDGPAEARERHRPPTASIVEICRRAPQYQPRIDIWEQRRAIQL